MKTSLQPDHHSAIRWLVATGLLGLVLALVFPDGHQQDAGHHFLFARFAAEHPSSFVAVWSRPLFMVLYYFPAQLGYFAAKSFTLLIALATAWQTWRFACDLGVPRPALVIPLLFVQPTFLLLASETMTEPLFALLFVVALRLHHAGRVRCGMLTASLLILVRPEGFVIGVLWGIWVLIDRRDPRSWWRRIPSTLLLATGFVLWWLAAYLITNDPLFILHDWPREWAVAEATYGIGPLWTYIARLPEIAGPLFVPFLVWGLWRALRDRRFGLLSSSFLFLFVVHTTLRVSGWLGSAGYARYFVCVAPAVAILTVVGLERITRRRTLAVMLSLSALLAVYYIDLMNFEGRDVRGITELKQRFDAAPRPITRLIWSQAYMAILFDRDPAESPPFRQSQEAKLDELRRSPVGTLVFWDSKRGRSRFDLGPDDFLAAGYTLLHSNRRSLTGWFRADLWLPRAALRDQEFFLFYKDGAR